MVKRERCLPFTYLGGAPIEGVLFEMNSQKSRLDRGKFSASEDYLEPDYDVEFDTETNSPLFESNAPRLIRRGPSK